MNIFKKLFSSSNLELHINDGGRAAAGYKGKAGQLVVDSDDDPDYGVAVDYDVKLGIFGN